MIRLNITTFILHGGVTSKNNKLNDYFFSQFSTHVNKKEVRILLCYFATEKSEWERLINRDKPKVIKNSSKKLRFQVAEDAQDLLAKLDDADVLYVAGGEPELLESYYEQLEGLKDKLQDKVYIGSSMGVYMVSESYLKPKGDKAQAGMRLLPIQTICHWDQKESKEQKLALLRDNSDSMILVLNEYQTVEIYR
ncbi:MAG: hypothetical protein GF390_00465 [Candidatus Pacebacteria bacterium]|nr:hypothetical protein [Candidatus Paceibacterota bacterium]